MRQIERVMIAAICNRKDWRCKNTEVACTDETINVYLHSNRIARYWINSGTLDMTLHGYPTVTTRSRLNAICRHVECGEFYQSNNEQYFDAMPIEADQVVSVRNVRF